MSLLRVLRRVSRISLKSPEIRWIGLTPILNYGTERQKREIIDPVLAGDKHIALAISEAFAGSDVAGLQTTATLSPDGKVLDDTLTSLSRKTDPVLQALHRQRDQEVDHVSPVVNIGRPFTHCLLLDHAAMRFG